MYDFPNSPTLNQVFGAYTWDGQKWAQTPGLIAATALPLMDGTPAVVGVSNRYAREDHVHPSDTSRVTNPNVIINGDFRVNQVVYVSGSTLAAGTYGHDQWKAGASGGDYSFTQLKGSTQITVASGKSLIQPIEDVNVVGGSYVLTWTGTAQARAGINTLTPSGSYVPSPLQIAGQTAGMVMAIEFNNGTLGAVRLESGTLATPFIMRPYDQELATCQRYYQIISLIIMSTSVPPYPSWTFPTAMRANPTIVPTFQAGTGATFAMSADSFYQNANHSIAGFANCKCDARL